MIFIEGEENMSRNPLLYKSLVVGVIVLFIGVGVQQVFAYELYVDKEAKENIEEYRTVDDYEEIITWVIASAHYDWIERKGIFRGSIVLTTCDWTTGTNLFGLRRSNGKIEFYREHFLDYVFIPRYIGLTETRNFIIITGIAIGNIEWR